MAKALLGFAVLAVCASSAMALTFTEDFNSHANGTTSWGSGGVWNEPTNNLKHDYYTFDGTLGPRTGNSSNRDAHAELVNSVLNAGEWGVGPIDFEHNQMWDHAGAKVDGMFVVLSDSPATAALVPQSGSLGSPINAIAIGHAATGGKNFSFFDGQSWINFGFYGASGGIDGKVSLTSTIDAAGNWTASAGGPHGSGTSSGTLTIANFSFDTVSIMSYGNGSGYFSGIDDIYIVAVSESASFAADFNDDGAVDEADLSIWQSSFSAGDGGDADDDGDTDGNDFLIWQNEFGSGSGTVSAAVPEPFSAGMLAVVVAGALFAGRRRHGT